MPGHFSASSSIREAFLKASSFLEQQGVQESRSSAELLLRHLLGWDLTQWYLRWEDPFPEEHAEAFAAMLERRSSGEPVQYILGEQEFYGVAFRVTPDVLIPRPETELLVEQAVKLIGVAEDRGLTVVDVGTGSGAIAVTIALKCPHVRVVATDLSMAALEVARGNAAMHGVAERVEFLQGDLLEPIRAAGVWVDVLLSNPPYIPSRDIESLQLEVRSFEPRSALDGGTDGLDLYRRLISEAAQLDHPPRIVGLEVGMGQADDVAAMLRDSIWPDIRIVEDLAGIERHVFGLQV